MNHRRNFLKKLGSGVALATIFPFVKKTTAGDIKLNDALVHHVFFWLKEPENEHTRLQFEKGLEKLLTVETIALSHVGIPASTEKRDVVDNSFTYSYMVMFNDKESHDIYQNHPTHLKFIEENSHLWERVVVYDSVG